MQSRSNLKRHQHSEPIKFIQLPDSIAKRNFVAFFDQSFLAPIPHYLPQQMRSHTNSCIFAQGSSNNCALLISAKLMSEEEVQCLSRDQHVKIGLITYLLLSEKITLETAKKISNEKLFARYAREKFSELTEDNVLSFKKENSPLLCVKYIDHSELLKTLPSNALESISIDYILSLPNNVWLKLLESATDLAYNFATMIDKLQTNRLIVAPPPSLDNIPNTVVSDQAVVNTSTCCRLFFLFRCCTLFSTQNPRNSAQVFVSEEETTLDRTSNGHF